MPLPLLYIINPKKGMKGAYLIQNKSQRFGMTRLFILRIGNIYVQLIFFAVNFETAICQLKENWHNAIKYYVLLTAKNVLGLFSFLPRHNFKKAIFAYFDYICICTIGTYCLYTNELQL